MHRYFRRFVFPILGALLIVYAWLFVSSAFMLLPPAPAAVWIIIVGAAFLWVHVYGAHVKEHARRVVRLRPLGRGIPWVLLAIGPMLLFQAFFLVLYLHLTGVPDATPNPLESYLARPGGWITMSLFVGVLVPIVEEFGIRGWIQHPLERRIGHARAIVLTSVIFAVAHFQLLGLPTRFFAGIFFGYAVWASRSIWAAVLLHAAHNLSLILPAAFARDETPAREMQTAPLLITSAIGLALMALILARIGARLRAECTPAAPVTPSATG